MYLVHESTDLENKLSWWVSMQHAALFSQRQDAIDARKELEQMKATESFIVMDAAIENGLKELEVRFRTDPEIPDVDTSAIFEEITNSYDWDGKDQDWNYWKAKYPILDAFTAQALEGKSDCDLWPKSLMFAYGNLVFSQSWTDSKLQQCNQALCRTLNNFKSEEVEHVAKMTRKKRGELYAALTWNNIHYMQAVVSLGDLKRVAKTLKELPPKDFQKYLEQAGLATEANNDKC
jgi:hypothetical protein